MLTRDHRLRDGASFGFAVRKGRRSGTRTLVLHLADGSSARPLVSDAGSHAGPDAGSATEPVPARVGLVVGKAVGNAVVRNTVKRRLRHLVRERLASLPPSALLVVRALPPAGVATSRELGVDLDHALGRLLRRQEPRPGSAAPVESRDGQGVAG